ncbi:MAG TPA: VWA domain-containing protein [Kofleriaceae bacterium]|nr:VWA domain-containing protein [Kofleriaceae bacterium]
MRFDPSIDVVGLGRALRAAGIPIGIDQEETFGHALAAMPRLGRRAMYLAARATLVTRYEDLAVFDDEFARWFGDGDVARPHKMPMAPRHDRAFVRTALGSFMAQKASERDPEVPVPSEVPAASAVELLQRKDFALVTEAEREAIARMMRSLRLDLAMRRSLRWVRARRGTRLDLARAVRQASRHGGVVLSLPRRARKLKRRPLVVLADISGSMELYSRLVLQFLHTVSRRHHGTEVFVFGTRLTRITPQLQLRDLDAALDRASREITDYAGGTRIGECFHAFDRHHARRVVRRGAVVLVISDGLDTGEPTALAREVAALRARSHRLVWLNPLLGAAGYRPIADGMAAALPYVDDFMPVRDLGSLDSLVRHLSRIPARR